MLSRNGKELSGPSRKLLTGKAKECFLVSECRKDFLKEFTTTPSTSTHWTPTKCRPFVTYRWRTEARSLLFWRSRSGRDRQRYKPIGKHNVWRWWGACFRGVPARGNSLWRGPKVGTKMQCLKNAWKQHSFWTYPLSMLELSKWDEMELERRARDRWQRSCGPG